MRTIACTLSALAAATLLSACANLAPTHTTPAAAIPGAWPETTASLTAAPAATEGDWQALVSDPRLRDTITLALANNRDLRQAVLAIAQARATWRIQGAASWPTINTTATASSTHTPAQASSSGQAVTTRSDSLSVGLSSYEIDLFGRVQNLKDAALASYLQTEQAQRSTRLSLVAEVATAWLTLAADQGQLALARATLASQQDSLRMTQRRQALGADTALAVAQAQTLVQAARRDVAADEAQVTQDRNALDLLAGTAVPASLLPDAGAGPSATVLVGLPAELPSAVLQRRPDVRAAEHQLEAANADIGAARAALFPRIALTASAGTASRSLGELFQGGAWSFVPTISLPIFDGGASRAQVQVAEINRNIRMAAYDKTLQTAFREVADALAVRASLGERLAAQQALVAATERSSTLAQARFQAGADSYLAVLDAQRSLYAAQQSLIGLQLAEQANRVTLFKVLGGGWRDNAAQAG